MILENNYDLIYNKDNNPFLIYGLEDTLEQNPSLENYNEELKKTSYKILLVHEPDYVDNLKNNEFDLVLSGHSHGGQVKLPGIKPFFLPEGCQKYYSEKYDVNNTKLFISNGVGTSKIKVRLGSTPSINLYRIVKE